MEGIQNITEGISPVGVMLLMIAGFTLIHMSAMNPFKAGALFFVITLVSLAAWGLPPSGETAVALGGFVTSNLILFQMIRTTPKAIRSKELASCQAPGSRDP